MVPASLFRATVSPGSACLVAAVPEEWIQSIPAVNPVTGVISGDIVLTDDRKWLLLVLISRTRFFKEENAREDPGQSWIQSISGRSCGHNADLHLMLETWSHHRWVIIYREVGTNATYLVGKPGSGALMGIQYSNERATISGISFARNSNRRALVYNGEYTLDNDVTISNNTDVKRLFWRTNGTEGTSLLFPQLQGKTVLSASRTGAIDLDVLTDPLALLDTSGKCYINSGTGLVKVGDDWPWGENETLLILYK